jgi:hypothetical protein
MDTLKDVPGSDNETCHENQVIDIKTEDVTDVQEDEYPVLIACPVIKAEQEVCHVCYGVRELTFDCVRVTVGDM